MLNYGKREPFFYPQQKTHVNVPQHALGKGWGSGTTEYAIYKCRKLTVGPPLMSLLVPLAVAERCGSSPRLFLSAVNADVDKTK